ncbi:MAG: hypothetical protein RLY93_16145 [Sumerlaeia bacterium]
MQTEKGFLIAIGPGGTFLAGVDEPLGSGAAAHGYAVREGRIVPAREAEVPAEGALAHPPDGGLLSQVRWAPGLVEILTDPAGAFPVYSAHAPGVLFLGTDAWAIAEEAELRGLNAESALALMAFEFVPGLETLVDGLEELPANCRVVFSRTEGGAWRREEQPLPRLSPVPAEPGASEADRVKAAAENLRAVCAPVASASGPVALNLSGGWDSRALLGVMAPRLGGDGLFTCTYGNGRFGGTELARRVSREVGIPSRFHPFDDGRHLELWWLSLCREMPPVARYNLSDGGKAVGENLYRGAALATCGHSGDGNTKAQFPASAAPADAEGLGAWAGRRYRSSLTDEEARDLLRPGSDGLAEAPGRLARETARVAWEAESPVGSGVRWFLGQRVRRNVLSEVRLLERHAPVVFLPMMEPAFRAFWAGASAAELTDQRLWRLALRDHVFVEGMAALGRLPREGGGFVDPDGPGNRAGSMARRVVMAAARRVAPGMASAAMDADPTVAWWRGDKRLFWFVHDTLMASAFYSEHFEREALRLWLLRSRRSYRAARTTVWNMMTVAGAERLLIGLKPSRFPPALRRG